MRIGKFGLCAAKLFCGVIHFFDEIGYSLAVFIGKHKGSVISAGDKHAAKQVVNADNLSVLKSGHDTARSVKAFERRAGNGNLLAEILFALQNNKSSHNLGQ